MRPRLEDLDQVTDLVLVEVVGQRAEADQVGETDRRLRDLLLLGRGTGALDPRDRCREVASPDIGQQCLEVRSHVGGQPQRLGAHRLLAGGVVQDSQQGGDLPLREPVHGLPDCAGHPHDRLEVQPPLLRDGGDPHHRFTVGGVELRGLGRLRKSERTPQQVGLLDRQTSRCRDLLTRQVRVLPEDRAFEVLTRRHGCRWCRGAGDH